MRLHRTHFILVGAALLVISLALIPAQLSGNKTRIALQAPDFVLNAQAANNPIGAKLDSEAGISAYFQSSTPINLNQVRGQFRTIEQETADYIIGSVAVPNYLEHFDAHVYVHRDGWVMAYYLKQDPVSKIADVKGKTSSSTLLKTVVAAVASAGGAAFTDVTYYDFRYPNATDLLIVGEDGINGRDFTISVPSNYGYYERSWSYVEGYQYWVDNTDMDDHAIWKGDNIAYGILTASQLLPDVTHTIIVGNYNDNYGVLVIVYRR